MFCYSGNVSLTEQHFRCIVRACTLSLLGCLMVTLVAYNEDSKLENDLTEKLTVQLFCGCAICQSATESVIGDGVVVGNKTNVKSCVIGDQCVIGGKVKLTNSVVMDHVTINEGQVSSWSLILQGAAEKYYSNCNFLEMRECFCFMVYLFNICQTATEY